MALHLRMKGMQLVSGRPIDVLSSSSPALPCQADKASGPARKGAAERAVNQAEHRAEQRSPNHRRLHRDQDGG